MRASLLAVLLLLLKMRIHACRIQTSITTQALGLPVMALLPVQLMLLQPSQGLPHALFSMCCLVHLHALARDVKLA